MDAEKKELNTRAALAEWANSLHSLRSDALSSVGIDDFGDLCDEVPAMREWMSEFWELVDAI